MKHTMLILLCATVGCGRGTDAPRPEEPTTAGTADRTAAMVQPNVLRIDPGMLRDLRVTTAAVESRQGGEEVALLGELAVDERTYAVVGVPVAARAVRVLASLGDSVRAGQVLAEFQSQELGKARSEYMSAEARVTLTERALERKRDLANERIAPQREVQEAEAEATEARAALRAATAALTALGISAPTADDRDVRDAAAFPLRAPVRGVVIDRAVVVGQMLDPATQAFRIADLSTLWLNVHAFERDAVRIMKGAAAELSFPALPGQQFTGTVSVVGREVDADSRTVPIRIDVRNSEGRLRPGMSATAAVPVGMSEQPILTVPVAAVQRVRNEWSVFIPKDSGTFEIRKIGRGRDLGGEVEVLSGVRAGDQVVVDGAFLLKSQAEQSETSHEEH